MIEKLEQLTMGQFIDLVCGNTGILAEHGETLSAAQAAIAMRNIVVEYREIADPAGIKSYISTIDEYIKARISAVVFTMCENMIKLNAYDNVREVLREYGVRVDRMDDPRIAAEVTSRLNRAKTTVAEIEADNVKDNTEKTNIRSQFDAQTAHMMAHFKFQIDTETMKATVYAHLAARCDREIKAAIYRQNKRNR